jgi:hypothetical protein
LPHTETECFNSAPVQKIILGGILLPFIIAAILALSSGRFMRDVALQIASFNLLISYKDYLLLGLSVPVSVTLSIFGGVIAAIGLGLVAKSKVF